MRLFLATAFLTTAFGTSDEPLTGGTGSPGHARFDPSPAHEYLVAKARSESAHREAIVRAYDWMGYNFGRPAVNSEPFLNAAPLVRSRRIYSFPGFWQDSRAVGL
jgi:hypothetical protein